MLLVGTEFCFTFNKKDTMWKDNICPILWWIFVCIINHYFSHRRVGCHDCKLKRHVFITCRGRAFILSVSSDFRVQYKNIKLPFVSPNYRCSLCRFFRRYFVFLQWKRSENSMEISTHKMAAISVSILASV